MKRVLSAFLLFTIANAAQGGGGYSYLRVGYTQETLQGRGAPQGDVTFSGKAIDLSMPLGDQWALVASQYDADPDEQMFRFNAPIGLYVPQRDIPQEFSTIGLLFHTAVGKDTDLLFSYEKGERKFWFMDSSGPLFRNGGEDGKRISMGLKSIFFGRLEARLLRQKFEYEDSVENRDNEITDDVLEGNYYLSPQYSLGLSFISNEYSDRYVVNVGASF